MLKIQRKLRCKFFILSLFCLYFLIHTTDRSLKEKLKARFCLRSLNIYATERNKFLEQEKKFLSKKTIWTNKKIFT